MSSSCILTLMTRGSSIQHSIEGRASPQAHGECTGEGILFIKHAELHSSSLVMHFNHLSSDSSLGLWVLNCPLLLVQFSVCLRLNHTNERCQAGPIYVSSGEMARGANAPFVPAVWERQVLNASNPHELHAQPSSATAGDLKKSIWIRLELVRKAKADVTEEYMRSVSSLMAYLVSDLRRAGFEEVDLDGCKGGVGASGLQAFISFTNKKASILLAAPAMERFVKELGGMLKTRQLARKQVKFIVSAL
uniref:Uncharacterized protein n=1 Tax=Salix viminalis TaxID=40686 RepID=A0A6N2NG32_SALVM